jgi:hypothetical protein
MHLLVLVLDNNRYLNDILAAWDAAGVRGVTILESTGLNRVLSRQTASPLFSGFSTLVGANRSGNNTLFAVIDGMASAESLKQATESVLGDLSQPNTGILFAVPLDAAWGYADHHHTEEDTQ